jgi:MFS family permease
LNILEALLPSLVSRLAPVESKGAAIGVYSTAQFLGAFAGGSLGGLVHGHIGIGGVFVFALLVLAGWFLLVFRMPEPKLLVTRILPLKSKQLQRPEALAQALAAIPGVAEAVVIPEEGVVYLKVDPELFSEQAMDLSPFQT